MFLDEGTENRILPIYEMQLSHQLDPISLIQGHSLVKKLWKKMIEAAIKWCIKNLTVIDIHFKFSK